MTTRSRIEWTEHSWNEAEQVGWRAVIQHALYHHICDRLAVRYASPFFLMSQPSHRALWFLHFSKHWRARDEIGRLHWQAASGGAIDHRGGPGFRSLGFTPARRRDPGQLLLDYDFDTAARDRSRATVDEQLGDLVIAAAAEAGGRPPSVAELFNRHCNDTPVTSDLLCDAIRTRRDAGDLLVRRDDGLPRRRGTRIALTDRLELGREPPLPGLLA